MAQYQRRKSESQTEKSSPSESNAKLSVAQKNFASARRQTSPRRKTEVSSNFTAHAPTPSLPLAPHTFSGSLGTSPVTGAPFPFPPSLLPSPLLGLTPHLGFHFGLDALAPAEKKLRKCEERNNGTTCINNIDGNRP